jgi:hypothetical protein
MHPLLTRQTHWRDKIVRLHKILRDFFSRNFVNLAARPLLNPAENCFGKMNKRPMGHIAHLSNLGPYRNIFLILNMYFIPICPTQLSGAIILSNLPLFYIRKLSWKFQPILTWVPEADHPFAKGNVMNMCTKWIATHVKFLTKVKN